MFPGGLLSARAPSGTSLRMDTGVRSTVKSFDTRVEKIDTDFLKS